MTEGAANQRIDTVAALRDAAITTLLAFGLFLPLIGFHTVTNIRNELELDTRWPLLFSIVAVVGVARLAYSFLLAPWLERIKLRPMATTTPAWRATFGKWFVPFCIGFVIVYPAIIIAATGFGGALKWVDNFGIQILIYVMLGWGLNIVVGLAGLLDLGYVAFYAVGAYSYALLALHFNLGFWECLPLAGIMAASFGVLLGFPVLRLRGDYLAIVTLGFGEMIRIVLVNWQSFTHGPNGIGSIARPSFFGFPFAAEAPEGKTAFHELFGLEFQPEHRIVFLFYLILALALITNWATLRLRRLPIGRAWEALREDEIACRSLGINPTSTKLSAFAIGAMFAGFAGSFFATRQGFISPESFTFMESAVILAIVVLGGMGSQLGVVVAAVFLIVLPELAREFAQFRMLLFGLAMVLIMLWRPQGLIAGREASIRLRPQAGG